MPIYIKDGVYKPAVKIWQKVGGVWVVTPQWWIRHGGQYKLIHTTRNPFYFNITLPNTVNFNLRDACIAAGWNQTDYVIATVTIPAGVSVTSSSPGIYAFSTGINFPPDSTLRIILDGVISGRGGNGAGGNTYNTNGSPATPGGPALFAALPCTLTGTGLLSAGGGGGGGGGGVHGISRSSTIGDSWGAAGGGGGGGGLGSGLGGSGTPAQGQYANRQGGGAGGAGTPSTSGGGGARGYSAFYSTSFLYGGTGGAGGMGGAGFSGGTSSTQGYTGPAPIVTHNPPSLGAPGGSAYAGVVNTASFTGAIIGLRG